MKAMRVVSLLGLVLGLLVGSAAAQSVQSDFDRTFQFSNLKTFSFAVQRRGATDPLSTDSLNDGRIRTGLESQLIANGFHMETGKADFVIAYYVKTKNKLSVQDYGYGPPRWFGGRDIRVNQDTEGTLMVDFIDARTNQVIWRGRAVGTLDMKGVDKKISKSTEKLVKQFVKDTTKKG
jgi:hypothetical protein